jgi:survival-of-motor-neuron-related-splicing factor 30
VSGDKGFYPARITSKTGSATDPVYIVTFKSYETTDTLRSRDLRPLSGAESRKRKYEEPIKTRPDPAVILAAPNINPSFTAKPGGVDDGPKLPKMPKKIKAKKELEAGKSQWQAFASKGKHKGFKPKESMFRTPEGINGKGKALICFTANGLVGFVGSGQEMRKDQARTRHIYEGRDEEDY